MVANQRIERFDCVQALVVFAILVAALQIVPQLVPTSTTEKIISAAATVGYNTEAAFWTVFVWAVLAMSYCQEWCLPD